VLLALAASAADPEVEVAREQGHHGQDYFCVLDRHPVEGLPVGNSLESGGATYAIRSGLEPSYRADGASAGTWPSISSRPEPTPATLMSASSVCAPGASASPVTT